MNSFPPTPSCLRCKIDLSPAKVEKAKEVIEYLSSIASGSRGSREASSRSIYGSSSSGTQEKDGTILFYGVFIILANLYY